VRFDQLSATGFSYDASGNLLTDGRNTYTWNAESEIKSAASVNYTYDGDGDRVQKSNGKLYWYGTGSDPLMETDLSGNLTDEYIFFGGKRIARRDSSNNVVYYAADHLGTSRVVASSTGAILDQSDFYPFGGERVLSASSGNTYKFTSKERDSESNLDNFGARYDSSILGRFMSTDHGPFVWRDPQTLNRYIYTRNNPLKYVDPSGNYFVVSSDVAVQVKEYISTLVRSEAGRNLVNQIGLSPKPTLIDSGSLPRTQVSDNRALVTNGQTTAIPGNTPGAVAGTQITLDFNNIAFTAHAAGQTDFKTGLSAFAHEDFHVSDANGASTLQGAVAALAAGDAPSRPGGQDTTGGTAEARASALLSGLGGAANGYTPNPDADAQAAQIIAYGQVQQSAQLAFSNAQTDSTISTKLESQH
jgi:RHS repeat-associated protein